MTCHYPDLASTSVWLKQFSHAARPITSITQIGEVTHQQYGISALIQSLDAGAHPVTRGSVAKCALFFQATCPGATITSEIESAGSHEKDEKANRPGRVNMQERIKGTEKASLIHTLFHR